MALIIEIIIACNGCNAHLDADTRHLPAKMQRKLMLQLGWKHTGGRDLCGQCRSKLKGGGYTHNKKNK